MKGLVLQGGGAKGAFQAGAVKALLEHGYTFDGVVGTSIGALNALIIAQGDFEILCGLWESMAIDRVLDIDADKWTQIKNKEFNKTTLSYIKDIVVAFFKKGGLDKSKAKALIEQYADEEKLRKSPMDFGLVTVKRTGEFSFEALTLFKEDIPEGMVADYVMASANFPLFTRHTIGESRFYDGGLYDNLPINMLLDKGYDDIVAIRLGDTVAPVKKPYLTDAKIMYIDPSDKIGSVLDFDAKNLRYALKAGYYDALRVIERLDGRKYCFAYTDADAFDFKMLELSNEFYDFCLKVFGRGGGNVKLEKYLAVSKDIAAMFKLGERRKEAWLTLIEVFAEYAEIDRFKIYTVEELLNILVLEYAKGFKFDTNLKRKLQKHSSKEARGLAVLKALLKEISGGKIRPIANTD